MVRLIFAILTLAMALIATSVQAQMYEPNYPVCMHVYGELEGERMDCIFTSLAQCAATASGRPAMCLINPYFAHTSGRRRHTYHLRHRLNDEQSDNGHNFLGPRDRSVKPVEENRTCAAASCVGGVRRRINALLR